MVETLAEIDSLAVQQGCVVGLNFSYLRVFSCTAKLPFLAKKGIWMGNAK